MGSIPPPPPPAVQDLGTRIGQSLARALWARLGASGRAAVGRWAELMLEGMQAAEAEEAARRRGGGPTMN